MAYDAAEIPAVRQGVASAAQVAASADRIANVTEKLPERLSKEREEIVKALREQEKEVAGVLAAGTQMSASLSTTLTTADALLKRLGLGEPKPPGPEAPPFRIQDYTQAVAQLDVTAQHLTELVRSLDRTLASPDLTKLAAQVTPAVQQAQASGKDLIDYAVWKGCLLIGAVLLAGLIYRFVAPRLAPATRTGA
jgi:ribonuclease D